MLKEEFLHQMLLDAYQWDRLDIYQVSLQLSGDNMELFGHSRAWVHQLIKDKLCIYTDEEKTHLQITNYGRYWMLHGGYIGFLKDEHAVKEKELTEKDQQKEALLEARLRLTHYRLVGFWMALIISIVGLVLSVFNLYLFLSMK